MFKTYLIENPLIQVMCLVYLNLFCLAYTAYHNPFSSKQRNTIEIFNEITIALTTESMLFYTGIVDPFS